MADIAVLPIASSVNEELARALRSLLARVESGEVLAAAVCGELTGRETFSYFAGDFDVARMVGSLEVLKVRIIHARQML